MKEQRIPQVFLINCCSYKTRGFHKFSHYREIFAFRIVVKQFVRIFYCEISLCFRFIYFCEKNAKFREKVWKKIFSFQLSRVQNPSNPFSWFLIKLVFKWNKVFWLDRARNYRKKSKVGGEMSFELYIENKLIFLDIRQKKIMSLKNLHFITSFIGIY